MSVINAYSNAPLLFFIYLLFIMYQISLSVK
ncbi:TPA: hypothetical protein O8B48_001128 [Staphylococcus aureus]|nr:hypothetical protein [Staphylococcus aureus]HDC3762078.1 hypothetical protein [Staphylococcus aureus]HDC3777482.1 hypothetical protein [Staphylococcus aureus]HDC3786210.1 hypothetical protein [Staphylococcus aureus]HDC3797611.1 hypothetical protein [Staphylococcus aureus]